MNIINEPKINQITHKNLDQKVVLYSLISEYNESND